MMCYYKWAVWQRAAISGCGEVWYRAWMGFKRPWVRISTLGPKISLRFGVGIFFCSYYRELKASCIWINGHRPWRRSAAGRPWVRISTLGPSNDNPNYIIQVGNVFGFIISIENVLWKAKGRNFRPFAFLHYGCLSFLFATRAITTSLEVIRSNLPAVITRHT